MNPWAFPLKSESTWASGSSRNPCYAFMTRLATASLLLAIAGLCHAAGLPEFSSDVEADKWLRSASAFYAEMARDVDSRGGIIFRSWDQPRGTVIHENGRRYIQLNPQLEGAERVSILIFEVT